MRKEDLKEGVWFRQYLVIFDIVQDNGCYMREGEYNYILLRSGDRVTFIPKDSIDIETDDAGEITGVHMRVSSRYLGIALDDMPDYPEEKVHNMIFYQASENGSYMNGEDYDYYLIDDNCKNLPILNFYQYEGPGWIRHNADKVEHDFTDEDESFRLGYEFAMGLAIQWTVDVIEEPGTKIIDATTGTVTTKK